MSELKSKLIEKKCYEILEELNSCLKESGWKGRYLGQCSNFSLKLENCSLRLYKQKAVENNLKSQKINKVIQTTEAGDS